MGRNFDLHEDHAVNTRDALEIAEEDNIKAAIIDLELQGDEESGEKSGLELIRRLRERTQRRLGYRLPIMVMTHFSGTRQKLECFEAGCDRFVAKPFDCDELRAELEAMLDAFKRERGNATEDVLKHGPIVMNIGTGEVTVNGVVVALPYQPYQILKKLLQTNGRVVRTNELKNMLWPENEDRDELNLHPIMSELRGRLFPDRGKIDPIPYIRNERGYRISCINELLK